MPCLPSPNQLLVALLLAPDLRSVSLHVRHRKSGDQGFGNEWVGSTRPKTSLHMPGRNPSASKSFGWCCFKSDTSVAASNTCERSLAIHGSQRSLLLTIWRFCSLFRPTIDVIRLLITLTISLSLVPLSTPHSSDNIRQPIVPSFNHTSHSLPQ